MTYISSRSVSSPLSNSEESECILEEEEKTHVLIVPLSHSNHRLAVKIMLTYCASNWAIYLFRWLGHAQSSLMRLPQAPASSATGRATPVYHQVTSFPFPSSLLEKEH